MSELAEAPGERVTVFLMYLEAQALVTEEIKL